MNKGKRIRVRARGEEKDEKKTTGGKGRRRTLHYLSFLPRV